MLVLELFKNRQHLCELLGLGANLPTGWKIDRMTSEGLLQPRLQHLDQLHQFGPNLDELEAPGSKGGKGHLTR